MAVPEEGAHAPVRGAGPLVRELALAAGLLGAVAMGLAAFVRVAPAGAPAVVTAGVFLSALLLLGLLAGRRRPVGPAAQTFARFRPRPRGGASAVEPTLELPDLGGEALDHAAVDADGFEHTVAALCARDGCTAVEVVGGAGDLGADVLATTADGRRVVLQCKHYAEDNRVGSQDLQRFGGTCFAVHGADVAVLVTTSSFTAPAAEYAETCGIVLVDGEALAAWTDQHAPPPWETPDRTGAPAPSSQPGGADS
ncbi:restriction endonuclease [Streptomyces sp. NPDC097619]|uniref:restriction endonuclease n=1 Tax=Streptomyces sp. NPDC097619 TaxID=3157228 RepID=UPI00333359A7